MVELPVGVGCSAPHTTKIKAPNGNDSKWAQAPNKETAGEIVSRREQLESMLEDDPGDTFLRYALAMELQNEDENDRSLELLGGLMKDDPPYVPAFFMSGQQLVNLERVEDARTVLRQGIEQARAQGDSHAAGEMSEFLVSLGQFGE